MLRKIVLIFLGSVLLHEKTNAQIEKNENVESITISIGHEVSVGRELSDVYTSGGSINMFVPFSVAEKIFIGPAFNFALSAKHLNEAAKDVYTNVGFGISTEYRQPLEDFTFVFGPRAMLEFYYDKISPRKDFGGASLKTIGGTGFSVAFSTGIQINRILLQMTYNHRLYRASLGDDVRAELAGYNQLYEVFQDKYKMNFSSITLSFGLRI